MCWLYLAVYYYVIECGFILKLICDMIITYSQMHRAEEYSQHSSNGWLLVYELKGCGCESRCSHLQWLFRSFFYLKHCHLWKKQLPGICFLSTIYIVLIKFTTKKIEATQLSNCVTYWNSQMNLVSTVTEQLSIIKNWNP